MRLTDSLGSFCAFVRQRMPPSMQHKHLCPYLACALPALGPASDGLSHTRKPSTRRSSGGHSSWLGAQGTTVSHRAASWLTSIHLDSTVPASPGGAPRHPLSTP